MKNRDVFSIFSGAMPDTRRGMIRDLLLIRLLGYKGPLNDSLSLPIAFGLALPSGLFPVPGKPVPSSPIRSKEADCHTAIGFFCAWMRAVREINYIPIRELTIAHLHKFPIPLLQAADERPWKGR